MTDATTDKLLPTGIPSWHMPYWDSLREHAVKVQKCAQCGAFRYIPKEICNRCFSGGWTWEPIEGTGTVYTHTTIRRAPTPAYQPDAPYTIVHVTMSEGFRMIGRLHGVAPEDVRIDMPVRVRYDELGDWTVLNFEAA
ncbi:hypothetical protein DEU37_1389 [Microbacterium sp. AG790]|uniref:Zn-ribbon domain-containing OB-fold protein n=1 Tax=Microbacterium sp. AG790 TaxID=2183995 RepID=UPI000EB31268|nr:OB-fold domain-containing protein [Microbacterium sp. AG790]RKS90070.1 hypothetical protein DEU37_1389 [Microbacterium sp. AG790]